MTSHTSKTISRLAFAILVLSFLACRIQFQITNPAYTPTPSRPSPVEITTMTLQGVPTSTHTALPATLTSSASITPTLPLVTITAINGNLYIRRGSGSDFNPIGVLLQGQTAAVMGRDILDEWLYIPILSETGKFGWVSTLNYLFLDQWSDYGLTRCEQRFGCSSIYTKLQHT